VTTDHETDALRHAARSSRDEITGVLRQNGVELRGNACRCPIHDDANASAGIYQKADGTWGFKCLAASCGWHGDVFDLRAALERKELKDVLPRRTPARANGDGHAAPAPAAWPSPGETVKAPKLYRTPDELRAAARWTRDGAELALEDEYHYKDPDTKATELVIFRLRAADGKKEFKQARPAPGGWHLKKPEGLLPVFNRTRLRAATHVLVVEGEKCVKVATPVLDGLGGWAATTSPGGAGKGRAAEADWSPLAGKTVYLWPDNDDGGVEHMKAVADLLALLPTPPAAVHLLKPSLVPANPPKGDVADFLAKCAGRPAGEVEVALSGVLRLATPVCPSNELWDHIQDIASGRLAPAPLPWEGLSRLTQALWPGTVTVLCGAGGTAKSFWALQACWQLTVGGHPAEYLALERGRSFHLMRLLAVIDGSPHLLDAEWIKGHRTDAENAYHRNRPDLDRIAPRITAEPSAKFTRAHALAWVKAAVARKARVLVIDPVTALAGGGDVWTEDLDFLMAARAEVEAAGASLVCVTHPKKTNANKANTATDDVAGGACWARFCDSLLWVRRPANGGSEHGRVRRLSTGLVEGRCYVKGRDDSDTYNRVIQLAKTRDGAGDGGEIAYRFGGDKMQFREVGLVLRDSAGRPATAAPAGGGGAIED
jgi:hypothetical protein